MKVRTYSNNGYVSWRVIRLRIENTAYRYGGQLQILRISSRKKPTRGGLPAWKLREGLTTCHLKEISYEMLHRASELAGCCEHGNEPSGSIKRGKFLD
jgi:hypothetical protein